jgi:carbon monoxide dehydrogenase subunit G
MATIHREFQIGASPDDAWAAVREVGKINELITFLGDVTVDGDRRTCELGDQGKLDELIVSVDDGRRRVAYSIVESPFDFAHHNASMQVVANGGAGSTFIWTTDVKPDEVVPALSEAIDAAIESFKVTLA